MESKKGKVARLNVRINLFSNKRIMYRVVGIKELSRSIGLWAMPEDAKEPDDGQAVRRASGLMGRGQGPITTNK